MMANALKRRRLFLRWSLINALASVFFAVLYVHDFFADLKGAPLWGALTIIVFTVIFSSYAGWLCWRLDDVIEGRSRNPKAVFQLQHNLNHIFHAIWVCQILGIIGALVGYREQTLAAAKSTSDAGTAVQEVFTALGNGLIATMLGVLCSLLFFVEYRLLEHHLGQQD
jgi:hypothetical protein